MKKLSTKQQKSKMKRIVLLISLITISFNGFSQLDLKLNASGLFRKKLEFGAEFGGDKTSIELMAGLNFRPWGDGIKVNDESISTPRFGFNTGLRYNYYFNPENTLDGWYVSPYANYRNETLRPVEANKIAHNRLATGVIFGRKGMINDKFGWLVEMGAGYNLIYGYKDKVTKQKVAMEESIPLLGSLTKIDLPFRVSVIYRIGE